MDKVLTRKVGPCTSRFVLAALLAFAALLTVVPVAYADDVAAPVTVTKVNIGSGGAAVFPELNNTSELDENSNYSGPITDYISAVQNGKIVVNGTEYSRGFSGNAYMFSTYGGLYIENGAIKQGENEIVLRGEGYLDKTIIVNYDGSSYSFVSQNDENVTLPANKTALRNAIAKAETTNRNGSGADMWQALQVALAAAQKVEANKEATQEEVDAAVDTLVAAQDAMPNVGNVGTQITKVDTGTNWQYEIDGIRLPELRKWVDDAFNDGLTSVVVNGVAYADSDTTDEQTRGYSKNFVGGLKLGMGAIVNGENTVVLSADGFVDKTVKFTFDGTTATFVSQEDDMPELDFDNPTEDGTYKVTFKVYTLDKTSTSMSGMYLDDLTAKLVVEGGQMKVTFTNSANTGMIQDVALGKDDSFASGTRTPDGDSVKYVDISVDNITDQYVVGYALQIPQAPNHNATVGEYNTYTKANLVFETIERDEEVILENTTQEVPITVIKENEEDVSMARAYLSSSVKVSKTNKGRYAIDIPVNDAGAALKAIVYNNKGVAMEKISDAPLIYRIILDSLPDPIENVEVPVQFGAPGMEDFKPPARLVLNPPVIQSVTAANQTYDGKAKEPVPTVKDTKGNTVPESGYTATYSNNVNAGTATVKVEGKGRYAGSSATGTFAITRPAITTKQDISKASVTGVVDKWYAVDKAGKALAQTQKPVVKLNGKTLQEGTDYKLTYANNKARTAGDKKFGPTNKATSATVTITGIGSYTGKVSKSFQIKGVEVYRLYNPKSGEHLYTTDTNERKVLTSSYGWKYEGVAWYAVGKPARPGQPAQGNTTPKPVYRVYQPKTGEHHYTTDANEVKVLSTSHGWRNEGVFAYTNTDTAKDVAVQMNRLYNPKVSPVASHHHTADTNEVKVLTSKHGWKKEGTSWYGC